MSRHEESAFRRLQDRVRYVNKRVVNPFTLRFAARPGVPYGAVRHVGRRSGRAYDTPVLVARSGDRFVVPLPYGTDVDWYRNVRAAGECTVAWQGRAFRADAPRLVAPAVARSAFPTGAHRLLGAAGAEQFVRLERGEEVPWEYRQLTREHPAGPAGAGVAGALLLGALAWRWLR